MSWLKMFGGKSSKSKSKGSSSSNQNGQNDYGLTPEEMAEAERSLPVVVRKDRLSVSKSGRHKLKNKQRLNLQDDTYATHGSIGAPKAGGPTLNNAATPSYNPSASGGSSYGASRVGNSSQSAQRSQGSVGRTSQQGSLGRNGAHCSVNQTSTEAKRFPARPNKNIPRSQTAV